jgi:hypothetical protein
MSINTVNQLYDALSSSLAWRIKELHQVKEFVRTSSASPTKQDVAIRAGVALLYAHWEGYIKEAATDYVEFVARQDVKYEELAANFVAIAMKGMLNQATQTNKATIYNKVAEFFLSGLSQKCSFSWENVIRTDSNLSSTVLREIVHSIGVDYSGFETKANLIDETLLHTRNSVAHGQYLTVSKEQFRELYDEVIQMLRLFQNLVTNAAASGTYKASP